MYKYKGEVVSNVRFYSIGRRKFASFDLPNGKNMKVESHNLQYVEGSKDDWIENRESTTKPVKKETIETTFDDEEVVEEFENTSEPTIKAVDLSDNSEFDLNEFGSDEFNSFVEEHKLNTESVKRVLDGLQKTHKGFTFESVI